MRNVHSAHIFHLSDSIRRNVTLDEHRQMLSWAEGPKIPNVTTDYMRTRRKNSTSKRSPWNPPEWMRADSFTEYSVRMNYGFLASDM